MQIVESLNSVADFTIGLVSPRRAAVRRHWRKLDSNPEYREFHIALAHARGYRAAKKDSSQTPWPDAANRSADAELLHDLPELRARSRALNRNDPIGSGLTGTFVRKIVGPGMRPQARTGDGEINTRLESIWSERADHLAPAEGLLAGELQTLIMSCVLGDGEMLIKESGRGPQDPIEFELIEGDRIGTPISPPTLPKGHELRDGIERDADGVVVAYYVCRGHPNDYGTPAAFAKSTKWVRVPADICQHLKLVSRSGQSRGQPLFHAILQDVLDLDLLIVASLKRVQLAACLAAFIKSDQPIEELVDATADKYGYRLDQQIVPGMIFKLHPNEDISTIIPNFPTPELEPFVIMLARRIGAALGVSWQIVLKDFSRSTYSSARTDQLESQPVFTLLQNWFGRKCMNWMWRGVMVDARLLGDPRMAGVTDAMIALVQWIGPAMRWIDPLKEVIAIEKAYRLGLTTIQIEAARLGYDWEAIAEQQKIEKDRRKQLGLLEEVDDSDKDKSVRSFLLALAEQQSQDARQNGQGAKDRLLSTEVTNG